MKKPVAYRLLEGGWLVRGTQDVEEAKEALLDADDVRDDIPEDVDTEMEVDVSRIGLFRFNPCHPSMCYEGHSWHLGYASKPGRGVFEGMFIEGVEFVEVEYDLDLLVLDAV